jgi:hypothetical protein
MIFKKIIEIKIKIFFVIWRRVRDSNPRYALTAYNGLANRRLQPLGQLSKNGGWGGIRTHEGVTPLPVFKTGAFNLSATHPNFKKAFLPF